MHGMHNIKCLSESVGHVFQNDSLIHLKCRASNGCPCTCLEGIYRREGIVLLILNLGTGWK